MSRQNFQVFQQQFEVDKKYTFVREIGQGAYGVVCAARNNETGIDVAIKKVFKIFEKTILAKRALREIKLLRHFRGHENITSLLDMDIVNPTGFNEVYLVQDLMEADLHQIIRSEQPLTDSHYQYFIYQICRGLKFIHSANVLHRDLKPGNLLVNADCELKICDFGLARGFSNTQGSNNGFMTEYVATRWYRAPDIMLSFQSYTKAIDVWSIGCILAEMLGGKPLFKGRDYVDQLNQIIGILGTPDADTMRRIGSERAQMYIASLPLMAKVSFSMLYPKATALGHLPPFRMIALDLLEKLLHFDPTRRITVEEALRHPYLATYHDEEDEPTHPQPFDFTFEAADDMNMMRSMIAEEVLSFQQNRPPAVPPLMQLNHSMCVSNGNLTGGSFLPASGTLPKINLTSRVKSSRAHPSNAVEPGNLLDCRAVADASATTADILRGRQYQQAQPVRSFPENGR